MLPCTTGARPGKMNIMSLPYCAISRLLPERKPSPRPTSSSREPTPQAIPNIVRNERSLCAHRVESDCRTISRSIRMRYTPRLRGGAWGSRARSGEGSHVPPKRFFKQLIRDTQPGHAKFPAGLLFRQLEGEKG